MTAQAHHYAPREPRGRGRKRPTAPHVTWGAPTITTHRTDDCTAPACTRRDWTGEDVYNGGDARCAPLPHWDAIVAESQRTGLPTSYRRDLYVHDRNHLARLDPARPFLWVLRKGGTHLVTASFVDGAGHGAAYFATSIPKIFSCDRPRVYTWDGRDLREHETPEGAADAMRELGARS